MGLFDVFKKKKNVVKANKLADDIPVAAEWVKNNLNQTGYKVDYDLESMKEIDRFFDEEAREDGILSSDKRGTILFGLASLVGETVIRLYGGKWLTDDDDPEGELNIGVELSDGAVIMPVLRCMKRLTNGPEDSIYAYVLVLSKDVKKMTLEELIEYNMNKKADNSSAD